MKKRRQPGFTLIELLTVIAIILVLAGLLIGIAGWAQKEAAKKRAQSEIQAISGALESYKADNGAYPSDVAGSGSSIYTNALYSNGNNVAYDPLVGNATAYQNACAVLYQAITGDGNNMLIGSTGSNSIGKFGTCGKCYMALKPAQTGTNTNGPNGGSIIYIVDPFGYCYGYSTAMANTGTNGFNPTFDLWSTCGTTGTTSSLTTGTQVQGVWVTNW